MPKWLRITLWILVPSVILMAVFAFLAKRAWDKITFFNLDFSGADFHGLTLNDIPKIIAGESRDVTVSLSMVIKNENDFSIPFCYLRATLFYEGLEIARTSDNIAKTCYNIPSKKDGGVLTVPDEVNIKLNKAGANLIVDKIKGQKPKIDYEVDLTIFGIRIGWFYKIKNSFIWE